MLESPVTDTSYDENGGGSIFFTAGGSAIKNPPPKAGDVGNPDVIPGSGRSPAKETATHPSILAWIIPWAEPAGLQSMKSQRVRHD